MNVTQAEAVFGNVAQALLPVLSGVSSSHQGGASLRWIVTAKAVWSEATYKDTKAARPGSPSRLHQGRIELCWIETAKAVWSEAT